GEHDGLAAREATWTASPSGTGPRSWLWHASGKVSACWAWHGDLGERGLELGTAAGFSVEWVRGAPGSLVGNGSPDRRGGAGGMRSVEIVVLLVAGATLVAAFAPRLRGPAPSPLVPAPPRVGPIPRAPA